MILFGFFSKALLEFPFVLKASPVVVKISLFLNCIKHIVRVSEQLVPQEEGPAPAKYMEIEARTSLPFL